MFLKWKTGIQSKVAIRVGELHAFFFAFFFSERQEKIKIDLNLIRQL